MTIDDETLTQPMWLDSMTRGIGCFPGKQWRVCRRIRYSTEAALIMSCRQLRVNEMKFNSEEPFKLR